jgi:hypothetical protein
MGSKIHRKDICCHQKIVKLPHQVILNICQIRKGLEIFGLFDVAASLKVVSSPCQANQLIISNSENIHPK